MTGFLRIVAAQSPRHRAFIAGRKGKGGGGTGIHACLFLLPQCKKHLGMHLHSHILLSRLRPKDVVGQARDLLSSVICQKSHLTRVELELFGI